MVVSYRDMSKDVEIQQMKSEVLRLRAELDTIHSFDEIIGKSQNMQQTFALIQRAAESDISVLISGESGTGKELVARAIHANSPRKAGPFVSVNCAAIPETLTESELFGHERGLSLALQQGVSAHLNMRIAAQSFLMKLVICR